VIERELHGPVLRLRMARSLLGRGVYHTAAYRVGELLVDSGCAHTVPELMAAIAHDGGPLRMVVNTHSHEDHIAGNHALQARYGARVLAHPLALPVLAAPRALQPQPLYRRVFWGYPEPSEASAIPDELEVGAHRFRVLHTPGHSRDHVCLYEPREGWLFAGDAFVGGRDRALRRDSDIHEIIESLHRLRALGARLLFPGSGTVYTDPGAAIGAKIEYLEELGARVRALHERGLGVPAIRRTLFGSEVWIARITRGDFDGDSLVRSYLSAKGLEAGRELVY
jgi:glyoxylase-like metal-dependent hydrolase (beta-lactamase superfamily II)